MSTVKQKADKHRRLYCDLIECRESMIKSATASNNQGHRGPKIKGVFEDVSKY